MTGVNPNDYNSSEPPSPPQVASYIVPTASAGSAEFTVTTPSGTTTVKNGMTHLALSGDQTRVAPTDYFYDAALNAEPYPAEKDRETWNISRLYGQKLSRDGRLGFKPTSFGIDVADGRWGHPDRAHCFPDRAFTQLRWLVANGTGNILVAITGAAGNGVALIDLGSTPEPVPLPYAIAPRSGTTPSLRERTANAVSAGSRRRPRRGTRQSLPLGLRATCITTSVSHRVGGG